MLKNNNFPFEASANTQEGTQLDLKRVLFRALRYWYLILASIMVALTTAFLINRYGERVYQIDASIIIRETQEVSEGKFLYNNPLMNPYRNYFNEVYIIKSYPLVQSVIERKNLAVTFLREGNLLTTDAYHYVPMKAVFSKLSKNARFRIRMIDQKSYAIRQDREGEQEHTYNFNDSVIVGDTHLLITHTPRNSLKSEPYTNTEFILTYNPPQNVTSTYVARLEAAWAEVGASVLNLGIKGTNPEKEVDFLNGLIEQYQAYDLEKKNTAASRSIEFIDNQLTSIRDSLRFFERQLERFKDRNVVTDLSSEALRLFQKLEALEAQKSELYVRDSYYKYLDEYLSKNEVYDKIVLPGSVGISDPVLTELIQKMVTLQLGLKPYTGTGRPVNPRVKESERMIDDIVNDIIESTETLKATDEIKSKQLNKEIVGIERQLKYLPVAERELIGIKRNYSLLDNLYIFLMQKMSEAEISKASTTSDIVMVNPPMVRNRIAPKSAQNYIIAGVLGLIIPFILFVVVELLNNKVQSKEDVEKIVSIPFIGGVGHNALDSNLVVQQKPKSAVAEAFRALRSNLNYFTGGQDKKIILVTSSLSGEGKTFTSINLATVLAMSGKKTIIIGADMRRPKIYDDFGLSNDTGLSNYLSDLASLPQVIQPTEIENLSLISGGPVPPNPSELLLKEVVTEMFAKLKEQFDYIILDTPPVALVTDAFVLSRFADHSLFVVRQNYTPKNILRIINDYYEDGRVKNISIVLNDIFKSGPGYGYGYGYGYSYGYGYGYSYGYGSKKKEGGYYTE